VEDNPVALKAILEKLDGVPEAMRALYVEQDGKFVLDVDRESAEEAFAAGLKRNRDEALKDLAKARAALKAWDGADPEEYRRLKQQVEEAQRKKAQEEGNWQALEKQLVERHTQEIGAKDQKIQKLQSAIERRLVQAQLQSALAKAGANPKMVDLLVLKGARAVRVRETDEDFEAFVADERGNPIVADGRGTPMTVDLYVEQTLKSEYPDAFQGSGSSGGGAPKTSAGGGGKRVIQPGEIAQYAKEVASGEYIVATGA
jgi:hypothetical protein